MKRSLLRLLAASSVAALLYCASANPTLFNNDKTAFLGTVTLRVTQVSPGISTQVFYNGSLNLLAGQYVLNSTTAPHNWAFCVDLNRFMHLNQTYTYELWLARGRVGALLKQRDSFLTGMNLSKKGAALQIAIWEVAHDGAAGNPLSLSSGVFRYSADATVVNLANGLLSSTAGQTDYYYFLRSTDGGQNLAMVPEPASMTALVAGASGLLLRRRRR
ncbi:MAG: PEP-CTERM sorting domain-containing protein [Armatimonadota bacterium]|nr:PEP-CTERM sorting domain-containing protein [Armatimonadota bacterium]